MQEIMLLWTRLGTIGLMLIACLAFSGSVIATSRIAVLNFELNDITLITEYARGINSYCFHQPLLEQALNEVGAYEIIQINTKAKDIENAGFGYLFKFNEVAANLGRQFGADWVIVGQHSKPGFLFSYLMVHLINVKTQSLAGSYAIELKGTHEKVTQRGVKSLANKIHGTVNQ